MCTHECVEHTFKLDLKLHAGTIEVAISADWDEPSRNHPCFHLPEAIEAKYRHALLTYLPVTWSNHFQEFSQRSDIKSLLLVSLTISDYDERHQRSKSFSWENFGSSCMGHFNWRDLTLV